MKCNSTQCISVAMSLIDEKYDFHKVMKLTTYVTTSFWGCDFGKFIELFKKLDSCGLCLTDLLLRNPLAPLRKLYLWKYPMNAYFLSYVATIRLG